jgi:ATP-dependent DNA helicase HFM1/MER3
LSLALQSRFSRSFQSVEAGSSSPLFVVPSSPTFQASRRKDPDSRNHERPSVRPVQPPLQLDLQHAKRTPETAYESNGRPVIQGIPLIATHDLPDRFRSIFPFQLFNAVQSKCFNTVYKTDDNVILASPTGSGKTVILELAICRLVSGFQADQYKVVYMAPTKSLCSERFRDWGMKLKSFGLECAELTGDTEKSQMKSVQGSNVIITTPEKWDSMTRKWKDHARLMQLVRLFLVDEVHILKDPRGATLEAVVSRMKSLGCHVRFVALSATVPNSEDIATWLGKNNSEQGQPAQRFTFDESFRPVKLQKHVVGVASQSNDFAFDKQLDAK